MKQWGYAPVSLKLHGTEKSKGVANGQDIGSKILNVFHHNGKFCELAKRLRQRGYLLRYFIK